MEPKENKKCSSKEHLNNDAKSYCPICKVYMCNKCDNFHSNLCQNHGQYNIDLLTNCLYFSSFTFLLSEII